MFHFWTGVFTIAGALRRQVWIDERTFHWTPNFYIVLVAPPGVVSKSTTLRQGVKLLSKIPGICFGPSSMTWQGLTHALEEAAALVPYGSEYLPMSCITCAVNELGTFLRPEDDTMIQVLIDLWDGQLETWTRRTVALEGQVQIENPWLNIMGCTTPSWLKKNFDETMLGGGLVSRIVFVYGDAKRRLVPYPSDLVTSADFTDTEKRLVSDLEQISQLKGEYELTRRAKIWGADWYDRHWKIRPEHMMSIRYEGYLGRKQTHIHKLAMVVAAAQRSELLITDDDLQVSTQMITGLETSMNKVFQSIGVGDSAKSVIEILAYVRAYGEIHQTILWRHMWPIMSLKEFEAATTSAIKAGYIRLVQRGNDMIYIAVKQEKEKEKDKGK